MKKPARQPGKIEVVIKAEAAPSERKPEQPSTIARVEGKLQGNLSEIGAVARYSKKVRP